MKNNPFNYLQLISSEIDNAQREKENYDLKNLNLNIYETGGEVYIVNKNKNNRKLEINKRLPELMAIIFKRLIIKYGAAVTNIEIVVPKKIFNKITIQVPITFKLGQARIDSLGEEKLYVTSKKFACNHLAINSDGSFPFDYSKVTGISINLNAMEISFKISNESFDTLRSRITV